jgi:hypothetical protein
MSVATASMADGIAESVLADRPGISIGELSTAIAIELTDCCHADALDWPEDPWGIDKESDAAAKRALATLGRKEAL